MKKKVILVIILSIIIIPGLSTGIYFAIKTLNQSNWGFTIGEANFISDIAGVPRYQFMPDGHIAVLPDGLGQWMMFWAGDNSYRTIGNNPYPENHTLLSPNNSVIGGHLDYDSWKNGGEWLYSVHRLNNTHLIGFIHAEDHWYPRNPEGIAWKSIAVSQSFDNGVTWIESEQIITSWEEKPDSPAWGGNGDFSVIWDENNSRWMCFYMDRSSFRGNMIHMAISTDVLAAPGTWKKWDGKNFTVNALGGKGKPLKVISEKPGSNPSISWNTYLNKWIMIWQTWKGNIYISGSDDLIHWESPRLVIVHGTNRIVWYPSIIGDGGDSSLGQTGHLYYGDFPSDRSSRIFYYRTITFYMYNN